MFICLFITTSCVNKNMKDYVTNCENNIGKNVVICGKEYKIIDYDVCTDNYLLHNHELIKAEFVYGYTYNDNEKIECDSIIDRNLID